MDYIFLVILSIFVFAGVVENAFMATNKISLSNWGSYHVQNHKGASTYYYGYDVEDPMTGNIQFKQEERLPGGKVTGVYGYVDANNRPHVVTYWADENGYRAKEETEGEPTRYHPSKLAFMRPLY